MDAKLQSQSGDSTPQQYQALLGIAEVIASHRDFSSLLHALAPPLRAVVQFDATLILLHDPVRDLMRIHVIETHLPGPVALPEELPVDQSPGGWVWQTQQSMIIDDTKQETRFPQVNRLMLGRGVRSYCVVPLTSVGRRLGALGFASLQPAAYSEADLGFLLQVAQQVSVAVDSALNFERATSAQKQFLRERDRLQLLLEVNNAVAAHLELKALLHAISGCLRKLIPHDGAGLSLYDPLNHQLRLHALESQTIGERAVEEGTVISLTDTPGGLAFTSRQTLLFRRAELEKLSSPLVQRVLADGVKSGCVAPLISHGQVLGTLDLASLREDAFGEEDLKLLSQIASQIAIAVENALNFKAVRSAEQQVARERDRLKFLLEVNNAVVSHLDLHDLIKAFSASLREVMPHNFVGITLYDAESNVLRPFAYTTNSPDHLSLIQEGMPVPLEGTPLGHVLTSGRPLLIPRPDPQRFTSDFAKQLIRQGVKSGCGVPLTPHGHKLGVLGVGSLTEEAFKDEDLELLTQVAGQIAIAVDNALNFARARKAEQEVKRQLDRLRLMLKITNALVSQLDLQELLHVVSGSICEAMGIDSVGVGLFDHDSSQLRVFAPHYPPEHPLREEGVLIPLEGSPSGLAFTSGQPVFMDQPDLERFPSELVRRIYENGYLSGGSIPLITQGRRLGVLGFASKREHAFSDDDKELLCQVANQVAIAVDNALNFARARAAEQEAKRQSDRLSLMLQINNAVVSQLTLSELVRVTSSCLREVLHHEVTGLSLYDAETNQMRAYMFDVSGNLPKIEEGTPLPLEGTAGGLAFTSGQPVFLSRLSADREAAGLDKRFLEAGIKSGGCVPLLAHGRKLGVLGVASFREDAFSPADQELLGHIANQIAIAVDNALAYREIEALKNKLSEEKLYLEEEINTAYNFEQIIGSSPALKRILKQVETVAPTDSTVLIQGETGTGKEVIARAIHSLSARRERTLVKLNCAAIPTGLLESELFGHERGAFTGAIAQRIGRFELANKGTLFLDEVGEIPLELQPKLLRVIQEQEFERLGSTRTLRVDARMIAATNRDLGQMVADRQFRDDLYYRLKVFPITIPPLRERREDIPLLVRFFAHKFARRMKKDIETIPAEAVAALQGYRWPGNIRELENFIERAVILTQGSELNIPLAEMNLTAKVVATTPPAPRPTLPSSSPSSEGGTLEAIERDHILRVLRETNWIVGGPDGAAARLGLKRTTLQARMKKLGITRQSH